MLKIKITRKKSSYDFIKNKNSPQDYVNNTKNNCQDTLILYKDDNEIFKCEQMQTVANYPNSDTLDTIKVGKFQVKCFVEPGISFANPDDISYIEIHGIINTLDNENQKINENSSQIDDGIPKGRWLIHSTFYPKTKKDTNFAYSAGCFIFKTTDFLRTFNKYLKENGIKKGDIINGELIEE